MAIDRTNFNSWIDDDGSGTTGTVLNKARFDDDILDPIDAELATKVVSSDPRLSDARTPTLHAGTHAAGGTDPVTVTQAQVSGLTTALGSKVETTDPRRSDARTPTTHAATHASGGSDPVTLTTAQVTGLDTALAGKVSTSDPRLSDARTPTAHATTHQPGGSDALAVDAAAATGSLRTLGTSATSACAGNDARLSDSRMPTAHAASHASGASDAVSVTALAGFPGGSTSFLRADATFAEPPSGGGAAVLYTHTQASAATTWTITHNLGAVGYPVTVVDGSGVVLIPDTITYTSDDVTTVTFAVAQSGTAYVAGTVSGGGGGGTGDVVGPASATDHALARYDTATGKLLQDSLVTVSDVGDVTMVGRLSFGGTTAAFPALQKISDGTLQVTLADDSAVGQLYTGTLYCEETLTGGEGPYAVYAAGTILIDGGRLRFL